jgi:hypothetical protein
MCLNGTPFTESRVNVGRRERGESLFWQKGEKKFKKKFIKEDE